jgi:hypothetical protein
MCIFEPVIARWVIIRSEISDDLKAFGYAQKALSGSIAFYGYSHAIHSQES